MAHSEKYFFVQKGRPTQFGVLKNVVECLRSDMFLSFIQNHSRTASWQMASTSSTETASPKPSSSASLSALPTLPPGFYFFQIRIGDNFEEKNTKSGSENKEYYYLERGSHELDHRRTVLLQFQKLLLEENTAVVEYYHKSPLSVSTRSQSAVDAIATNAI